MGALSTAVAYIFNNRLLLQSNKAAAQYWEADIWSLHWKAGIACNIKEPVFIRNTKEPVWSQNWVVGI